MVVLHAPLLTLWKDFRSRKELTVLDIFPRARDCSTATDQCEFSPPQPDVRIFFLMDTNPVLYHSILPCPVVFSLPDRTVCDKGTNCPKNISVCSASG